jgi:hypothetical protein
MASHGYSYTTYRHVDEVIVLDQLNRKRVGVGDERQLLLRFAKVAGEMQTRRDGDDVTV